MFVNTRKNFYHKTIIINTINSQVNITKIDDLTFNVVVGGSIMAAFEKLGNVQKQVNNSCGDEYTLKTVYGEGQDARFILKKN